jgi:hypothetical protein
MAIPAVPRLTAIVLLGMSLLTLSGCGASLGTTASPATSSSSSTPASATSEPTVSPAATSTPAPTIAPSPTSETSPSAGATGVPTNLDPCALVTQPEASTLGGVTFGAGTAETSQGNAKLCSYGAEGSVVEIVVGAAADTASAQAGEQQFKTQLEQESHVNGLKLTELPAFESGVDAAVVEGSAAIASQKISIIALYLLKGTTYVGISDIATLGATPASASAMEAQGHTTAGRLP